MSTSSVGEQERLPPELSTPPRVAAPGEAVSREELQLAARNHGMPLEALAYDLTPAGLHYLLTHFDMPVIDPTTWRLQLHGRVRRPYVIGLAELRSLDRTSVTVTFECAGNGRALMEPRAQSQPWLVEAVGTAEWTGVALPVLLERAGLEPDAVEVVFTGADHGVERGIEQDYQRALEVGALDGVVVAYEMNGDALPPQHGFPVRLVVPGWYGMTQVKWLTDVEVRSTRFDGFQHHAYRLRSTHPDDVGAASEEGIPVTRIEPRALLIPPGFPDYYSRTRVVRPGEVTLTGRAWSGWAPVTRVEVSTDGGATWFAADLDAGPAGSPYAWRRWRAAWEAEPGDHRLGARAHDASGRSQPVHAGWNRGGFANNSAQLVPVVCLDG